MSTVKSVPFCASTDLRTECFQHTGPCHDHAHGERTVFSAVCSAWIVSSHGKTHIITIWQLLLVSPFQSSWTAARSTSWAWRSVCQSGAISHFLGHIGHGLGRRQQEAQHGCEEDDTGAGESKEQVEGVPGQAGNAEGTQSLLGEETVKQSAHILVARGCCQHTLGQSKCQSNSQAKGKRHHGRRRLHAGFPLFNWCCHGCANLVTWSLTLSKGRWDKALNGWQSKDHQAASNHLGGKSHLASSADKGQLGHGHCLTG